MIIGALACGWALLVVGWVGGDGRRRRVAVTRTTRSRSSRVAHLPAVRVLRRISEHRAERRRAQIMRRELPVAIELLAVGVGAGCSIYEAVVTAETWAPPLVAAALADARRRFELGASLADALAGMARAQPVMAKVARALADAARSGAALTPILATLGADERAAARRRAEAHARRVPVRLLFPLVFLVLPAFGLLTVVPVLLAGFTRT